MTTLAPFLQPPRGIDNQRRDRHTEGLNRILSLFLRGIAQHAYEPDAAASALFQNSIRRLRQQLDLVEDEDSALLLAAAAIRALEDNTRAADAHLQARQNEFEKVIAVLCDTLLDVTGASEETMVEIKEIERDIARSRETETLEAAGLRMAAAVSVIRDAALTRSSSQNETEDVAPGEIDGATGLPDSLHGAAAISAVWNYRADYYAAIFAAERLETINARFGLEAGDQVLHALSNHIAQHSQPGDQLFRWKGPCVVSILQRRLPRIHVTTEVARTGAAHFEHVLSIKDRDAIVSVSTASCVFPLSASRTVKELISRLDGFAATRSRYPR
jgi:GGDEF domain-containing protein